MKNPVQASSEIQIAHMLQMGHVTANHILFNFDKRPKVKANKENGILEKYVML